MARLTHVNNFLNRTNSEFFSTPEFIQAVEANAPAAGGGIDGTMVAMATASGTPLENGQSIIDAYNSVAGKHYDTKTTYLPMTEPRIINLTGITRGFMPTVPGNDRCVINFSNYGYNPLVQGQKYKGTITTVDDQGNNPIDATFYFIVIDAISAPGQMIVQYCTYGDEKWNGDGFMKKATRTTGNPDGTNYDPFYSGGFNIQVGQNVTFEQIITVKPTVILPPGTYELPSALEVIMPVNFAGLSRDGVVLNMGAHYDRNIAILYGNANDVDPSTGELNPFGEVYFKDQSISFENITFDFGAFYNDISRYSSSITQSIFGGVRLVGCALYGGFGNGYGPETYFGYIELNNCELHIGIHLGGIQYTNVNMKECEFIGGNNQADNSYADLVRLGNQFNGSSQRSHWTFEHCYGQACYFLPDTNSYVKANYCTFLKLEEVSGNFAVWEWNYVKTDFVGNTPPSTPITNFCVGF